MGGTLKIILWLWSRLLWQFFIWTGTKLFNGVDIYSPDKDIVVGVTFSNDKKYLKRIEKIEFVSEEWTDEEVDILIEGLKQKIAEKEARHN